MATLHGLGFGTTMYTVDVAAEWGLAAALGVHGIYVVCSSGCIMELER